MNIWRDVTLFLSGAFMVILLEILALDALLEPVRELVENVTGFFGRA